MGNRVNVILVAIFQEPNILVVYIDRANLRLDIKVCGKSSRQTTLLGTKTFSTRTIEIVSQIGALNKEELSFTRRQGVGHGNIFHVRVLLSSYPIGNAHIG